ncbi:MAG TPA: single-stranded DNA-binding protein [Isosphaeraceae bacterium]|jgi:single-strand DNA-binding protein|nr:single-stranded DNA-binding protein [Isosphaeraceae bacterium]
MADLNKVFLIGRLTQDPELRYTPNRVAVIDLRLATSRSWTNRDGERKDDTLFIDVTVWNRQAEMCGQFLKKGSQVHVEGYLKSESWESQTGEKRSKIKVEADRVQFLDRREQHSSGEPAGQYDEGASPAREPRRAPAAAAAASRSEYSQPAPAQSRPVEAVEDDEDIPF